jgi:hypothetical protein
MDQADWAPTKSSAPTDRLRNSRMRRLALVQMRLEASHREIQDPGVFPVVIPFDLMQQEYGSVTWRQVLDRSVQHDAIHRFVEPVVSSTLFRAN